MSQLKLTVYANFEQSGVQRSEWKTLLENAAQRSIFLTPEFLLTALEHIPYRTEKARVLVLRHPQNHTLLGLFFFRNTRTKWKLLQFNMQEYTIVDEVDQPYPIVHHHYETQAWQMVMDYFKQHKAEWDIFDFMELSPQSPIFDVVSQSFKLPFFVYRQCKDTNGPVVDLSRSWESFSAGHKKMRKKIRKMKKDFGERFEFEFYHGEECQTYLDQYVDLEKLSWKAKHGIGITKNQHITDFYQHFFDQLSQHGQLYFGFIYIDGKLASGEIAYGYGDTVYFAHGSYDPAFQKYSPGMVSTALLIKELCGKDYTRGDFLTGFASYINPWASQFNQTQRLTLFKLTPRMLFVLILVATKKIIWFPFKKFFKKTSE